MQSSQIKKCINKAFKSSTKATQVVPCTFELSVYRISILFMTRGCRAVFGFAQFSDGPEIKAALQPGNGSFKCSVAPPTGNSKNGIHLFLIGR